MSYKPSNPNGQALMAASEPVVIASNQTAIPVSGTVELGATSLTALETTNAVQSGTWTVQPGNTANTTPWLTKQQETLGTATLLGALNAEIVGPLNGAVGSAVTFTATATPVGLILTPYVSYDGGTNWSVTQFFNSANGDAIDTLSSFVLGTSYSISTGDGATHIKVRLTSWTSGSITTRLSSSNSMGLVNLKASSVHDSPAGSFLLQAGAVGSSTAPAAVSANGDAVRLWATTSGALNIADGGGSLTVDGTFWQATQPVSLTSVPSHAVTNVGTFAVQASQVVGSAATRWYTQLSDGTNSPAIKAASIAAASTDPALVVSVSPNNSVTVSQATAANLNATVTGTVELGPTSLAALESTTAIGPLTNTELRATAVPISGTFWQATQPVSLVSLPTLPAGTNNIGDVDVLSVIPGTSATSLGKQTDSPAGTTDTGVAVLGIRDDVLATLTPADGDYTRFRVNSVGRLWASATIDAALPAGTNAIGKLTANTGVVIGAVELAPATTNATTNATTTAYAASLIVKASAGTIYSITGYNAKTSTQFIQIHDSATLPTEAAVPKVIFSVPANSNFSFDLTPFGRSFAAGITICNSSTGPTKTIGAADCWFDVQYK